jgi:hypothetical protein
LGHRVNDLLFVANITYVPPSSYSESFQYLNRFSILFGASTPNCQRPASRSDSFGHAETNTRIATSDNEDFARQISHTETLCVDTHLLSFSGGENDFIYHSFRHQID